jgi:hypothetical protein
MFIASMQPQTILTVVQPVEQCCYCWYLLHPQTPYPEEQSSTICNPHSAWLERQALERRARRQAEKARVQA